MIRTFILAAAIASTTLSGGVAFAAARQTPQPPAPAAQPAPPPPHAHGGQKGGGHGPMAADANRDGIVTRAEAMAQADRMFAMRDANKDGRLTGAELAPKRAARPDAPRPGPDAKPREITKVKFEKRAMRKFDKIDTNRDGQIARAEIKAHRQDRREKQMSVPGAGPRSGADDQG